MPKRDYTLFDKVDPVWKVRDLIKRLGGVGSLQKKLMAKGLFPPGPDIIQGWYHRNSLPGCWSPAVFALAIEEGIIRSPMDALIRDTRLSPGSCAPLPPQVNKSWAVEALLGSNWTLNKNRFASRHGFLIVNFCQDRRDPEALKPCRPRCAMKFLGLDSRLICGW